MKRLFIYFLILLAAVWLGLKIQADTGYVLIYYKSWTVETTLWMAILTILVGFLIFYLITRFIYNSKILPKKLQLWWHNHCEHKAIKWTNLGLLKMMEETWPKAEKYFIKAARNYPNPFLCYLKAAYTSQKQNSLSRRDNYLTKAHQSLKNSDYAVGIIQAKMQITSKQWEQATATLKHLQTYKPRDKVILRLLSTLYCELHDWPTLQNLLPDLRRREILPPEQLSQLERKVYTEFWQKHCNSYHPEDIKKLWIQIPRHMRHDAKLISLYAGYLLQNNLPEAAESLLYDSLDKTWDAHLLELYSSISSKEPMRQLTHAEKWLKSHSTDPDLLICLGRLCKKEALWGKARSYLEKSIKLFPNPAAYLELGQVMESIGDKQIASDCYRKGLQFCNISSADAPDG